MSVIKSIGEEARASLLREEKPKKKIDYKKLFIKLNDGESVRVRLLGIMDYAPYEAHEAYGLLKPYRQPCRAKIGKCAYDEAYAYAERLPEGHELKKFVALKAKERWLFAFADIDMGEIRLIDLSRSQAKTIVKQIEEYKNHIDKVAFKLSRTGSSTDTTYTLSPLLSLDDPDQVKFAKFDGVTVDPSLYGDSLYVRTYEQQLEALKNAGFPIEVLNKEDQPLEFDEDDLPF